VPNEHGINIGKEIPQPFHARRGDERERIGGELVYFTHVVPLVCRGESISDRDFVQIEIDRGAVAEYNR